MAEYKEKSIWWVKTVGSNYHFIDINNEAMAGGEASKSRFLRKSFSPAIRFPRNSPDPNVIMVKTREPFGKLISITRFIFLFIVSWSTIIILKRTAEVAEFRIITYPNFFYLPLRNKV